MKELAKVIRSVPKSANVIGYHVVFRRKPKGLETFKLLFSIAAKRKWTIAEMYVKGAYLQAKGFICDVYVRPPSYENSKNHVWKLTKAAYGLADSGSLWYLTLDARIITKFKATHSRLEPILYYRKSNQGILTVLPVVQVDDYIYTGTEDTLLTF